MDGGRIILDKSEGHQCNINLSNAIVEDEGLWYFHIIYGTNLKRKLYFHKVRVNVKPGKTTSVMIVPNNVDIDVRAGKNITNRHGNEGKDMKIVSNIVKLNLYQNMNQQFVNKLSRIPSEVAKQNASSALLIIGVVCALALIVAVVVIAKRKSKNNIEDKEVPGS